MKREIITTKDGSKTIHLPEWNESYHSTHGAIQEAKHVFIQNGLAAIKKDSFSILEIGLGSGLNAILTFLTNEEEKQANIDYTGLEAHPISDEEFKALDYINHKEIENYSDAYNTIHQSEWNSKIEINSRFTLTKREEKMEDFHPTPSSFDLIYFDAFGPRVQPEMWKREVLKKMYDCLRPNGILVTYCAKGEVRRNLIDIGFLVEKLPGPPGKREMLRATRK